MEALRETGLNSTLVVVAGDHGEELGEHGGMVTASGSMKMCPCTHHVSYACIKEKKIEKLADLSDIAPTVLGIADIEIPTSYIGNDLTSDSGHKNYIQMEVFHRGNCLFEKKPLYMAVRSKTHKYIWKEWQDLEDLTSTGNIQLYDLKIDPEKLQYRSK